MNNNVKYILQSTFNAVAILLSSGAIAQAFMLYLGISENQISVYSSLIQFAQVSAMLVFAFVGDKFSAVLKVTFPFAVALPSLFLFFLIASSPLTPTIDSKYIVILVGSIIVNLALGSYNVLCYKFPYFIINMSDFGSLTALSGIFSSVASISVTSLLSYLTSVFDYLLVISIAFIVGAILWLLGAIFIKLYKELPQPQHDERKKDVSLISFIKQPIFYKLLPAHILRGIANGIFMLVAVIGAFDGVLDSQTIIVLSLITSVSSMIGNLLYSILERKIKPDKLIILSAVLFALSVFGLGFFRDLWLYLTLFFIANASNIVLGICVPVIIVDRVDYEYIGKYTSWRMLLFTGASALPGLFLGAMLESVSSLLPLAICAITMIVACVLYSVIKNTNKKPTPTQEQASE